jgi:hypothetical protein
MLSMHAGSLWRRKREWIYELASLGTAQLTL